MDVGERELRTIVARLQVRFTRVWMVVEYFALNDNSQKFYKAEELLNSKVVVLANLKPRKLCNVQSQVGPLWHVCCLCDMLTVKTGHVAGLACRRCLWVVAYRRRC